MNDNEKKDVAITATNVSSVDDVGHVSDVNQSTLHFILLRPQNYLPAVLILGVAFFFGYLTHDYFDFFFFGMAGIFVLYAYNLNIVRGLLMRQFAKDLGYKYTGQGNRESVVGSLFGIGHSRSISHVIDSINESHPVRIFFYSYIVGEGKSSHTYQNTVFEKTFDCIVPHILVHKPDLFFSNDIPVFEGGVNLTLEGDFNKYFSLTVQKDFEMEAYEIFTPDVMEELIETSKKFGFEFIQNKLYIYTRKFIDKRTELDDLFTLSEKLCSQFESVLHGMEGDVKAVRDTLKK